MRFQWKCVIFSCVLVIGAKCSFWQDVKSSFINTLSESISADTPQENKTVSSENVTYYLFTKNNPDEYIQLNKDNFDLLSNKKIVFIIHGWTGSREVGWYENLKNAFLINYEDYSIVEVDWKEPANQTYPVSANYTDDVGEIIADLIVDLNQNHGVKIDDILLIGHSLGGQITGFVGKNIFKLTGRKLPRIIALDPAGPLFLQRPEDKRLNKDDAEIVQVIHSDGGAAGFENATGTIDFFPNGGKEQPGCATIDLQDIRNTIRDPISCNHHRAHEYFVEAILNPKQFPARKCESWDLYKEDKCENEEVTLGDITTNAVGKFFLETNRKEPFAKLLNSGGLRSKWIRVLLH